MKIRYVLLFAFATFFLFTAGLLFFTRSNSSIELSQQQFEQMLSARDVQEVVLVSNQHLVEITLHDKALQKPEYWNELAELSPFSRSSGPHYRLKIANTDIFDHRFTQAQQHLPVSQRIGYQVEERSGYLSFLLNWGFIFLLFFGVPILLVMLIIRKRKRWSSSTTYVTAENNHEPPSTEKILINFPLKLSGRVVFTPVEEIACFYAQDNHVYLYDVRGKEHLVEYTLADLESKLPAQFIRVHRSYIVNTHLIREIKKQPGSRFAIKLRDEQHKEIVTGQSYAAPVKQLFEI